MRDALGGAPTDTTPPTQPEVTPTAMAKAVTTGNIRAAASTRGTTR